MYVQISLAEHDIFRREGCDLICDVPITYTQAVLGGQVNVPTLNGEVSLEIPPGTPSGKVLRIKGKGIRDIHSGRVGDINAALYIFVPHNISGEEREVLEKLATLEGKPVRTEQKSFLDRVKDIFHFA